jgi:hypothetical protein
MESGAVVFWWIFGAILGAAAAIIAVTVLFLGLFVIAGVVVKWWSSLDDTPKNKGKKK